MNLRLKSSSNPVCSVEEALLTAHIITSDQLAVARCEHRQKGGSLSIHLIKLGLVSEEVLTKTQSECSGWPLLKDDLTQDDWSLAQSFSEDFLCEAKILPWKKENNKLSVIIADVYDLASVTRFQQLVGSEVTLSFFITSFSHLENLLQRAFFKNLPLAQWLRDLEAQEGSANDLIMKVVDGLIYEALQKEASDLHFEPSEAIVRVRLRIHGVLQVAYCFHRVVWQSICVRLKVMAELDIAESRLPQDGRFTFYYHNHPIDCRVACHPVQEGENIVIRLLRQDQAKLGLTSLGIRKKDQRSLSALANYPEGMILVTGPTGSGKTTTLYALLAEVNSSQVNIMTLEDPIEYRLPLVRQTQVREGFGFSEGVRSLLRQDPDILLIGEIRDQETALMAAQAALTGHQVYATLHATGSLGAFYRLLDLGVRWEMIIEVVRGVISQRLLRYLCGHCKVPYKPDAKEKQLFAAYSSLALCSARGCVQCAYTGYSSRFAALEVLHITEENKEHFLKQLSRASLLQALQSQGFETLWEKGIRAVAEGKTSLAELKNVISPPFSLG